MESNINNNLASNTNENVTPVNPGVVNQVPVSTTIPTPSATQQPVPTVVAQVTPGVVNQGVTPVVTPVVPTAIPVAPVSGTTPVVNPNEVVNNTATVVNPNPGVINTTVPPVSQTTSMNNSNNEDKKMKKTYIWIGIIVGLVLVIAGILLYFLLTGDIANRNRYTCTKTTQEDGYEYFVQRYYTFDSDMMVRVYYTYEFRYKDELTDDMYNQTFEKIINNDTNGITKYGLNTFIEKTGNLVKITAYEPNYLSENFDAIKKTNKNDGYTCE